MPLRSPKEHVGPMRKQVDLWRSKDAIQPKPALRQDRGGAMQGKPCGRISFGRVNAAGRCTAGPADGPPWRRRLLRGRRS
jgi:hypothetical protein